MLNQAVGRLETAREVAAGGESVSPEKKRRILRNLHAAWGPGVAFVDLSTHIDKFLESTRKSFPNSYSLDQCIFGKSFIKIIMDFNSPLARYWGVCLEKKLRPGRWCRY